jgi:pilus assembly protein Flp/PilA
VIADGEYQLSGGRMQGLLGLAHKILADDRGQDLIEYALLGALIAVACIAAEQTLATAIVTEFGLISSSL